MSSGAPWTDEETQFFIDLRNKGWSYSKMLTHPECRRKSVQSLSNRLSTMGVAKAHPIPTGRRHTHSMAVRERAVELRKTGLSYRKIGEEMNLTEGQVRNILYRMGWRETRHGEKKETKVGETVYKKPTHPLKFTDEQLVKVGVIRKGESK